MHAYTDKYRCIERCCFYVTEVAERNINHDVVARDENLSRSQYFRANWRGYAHGESATVVLRCWMLAGQRCESVSAHFWYGRLMNISDGTLITRRSARQDNVSCLPSRFVVSRGIVLVRLWKRRALKFPAKRHYSKPVHPVPFSKKTHRFC